MGCAVYFTNVLPVFDHDCAVLYCFWYSTAVLGLFPDYLCMFACTACASLPEALRDGKLAPSETVDMYVGYDLGHKSYRIHHPPSRDVTVSTQIRFDGSIFLLADSTQMIDFHQTHEGVCLLTLE